MKGITEATFKINNGSSITFDFSNCETIKDLLEVVFSDKRATSLWLESEAIYDDENTYYTYFFKDDGPLGYRRVKVTHKYNSDGDLISVLPVSDDTIIHDILYVEFNAYGAVSICHYSEHIKAYEEE